MPWKLEEVEEVEGTLDMATTARGRYDTGGSEEVVKRPGGTVEITVAVDARTAPNSTFHIEPWMLSGKDCPATDDDQSSYGLGHYLVGQDQKNIRSCSCRGLWRALRTILAHWKRELISKLKIF